MTGREGIAHRRPHGVQEKDRLTFSNYEDFQILDTKLNLEVLFDDKTINGNVTFDLKKVKDTKHVVLDASFLVIKQVVVNKKVVEYNLGPRHEPYGSALEIKLDEAQQYEVSVEFTTTNKSTSIQFIRGDTGPYLFSQSQMIHARSFFPCFDTPAFKSTYTIEVKSPYKVLMSARPTDSIGNIYKFRQPVPVPTYLVSIASGNIVSEPIGPRSKVYCEQPKIADCKWEFEKDMEDFLEIAEKLTFKYEWETFDVLVMPMSFPYGGMENPNVTFATSTLICKDRSEVKVVAHELAHSWSGNLVTNCNWDHLWLNEGWCVYLERRILGGVAALQAKREGKKDYESYGEKYRHFESILGYNDLLESHNEIDEKFACLVWDLSDGANPDDAYSKYPYEKGYLLLIHLETILGIKNFDEFIPHYFKTFRYTSLDTFQFIDELYNFFEPRGLKSILDSVDFDKWLYGKGVPELPAFDRTLVRECEELVGRWVNFFKSGSSDLSQFDQAKDIQSFTANQHKYFLDELAIKLENVNPASELIIQIANVYPYYNSTSNFPLIYSFNDLLIKFGKLTEFDDIVIKFADWLGTVGRMKYVRPGYRLLDTKVSHEFAIKTYKRFANLYHPIAKGMVEKDIGYKYEN